ncbi:MAG: hypothetical protein JWO35_66 [Candidatus Saccharibacteria bacterium]|nr:hypothetical protein [Candidatus Saccharibacteria bacterium]
MLKRKNNILWLAIVSLCAVALAVFVVATINKNGRIAVSSDKTPLKLEIGDQTYNLDSRKKTITLPRNAYDYRISSMVEGRRVMLTGKVDLLEKRSVELNFRFGQYTKQAVSDAICSVSESTECPFTPDVLMVKYIEENQWAVVHIDSPIVGLGKAVLHVSDGKWEVVGGPGTDLATAGYYPQAVQEAIENDQ